MIAIFIKELLMIVTEKKELNQTVSKYTCPAIPPEPTNSTPTIHGHFLFQKHSPCRIPSAFDVFSVTNRSNIIETCGYLCAKSKKCCSFSVSTNSMCSLRPCTRDEGVDADECYCKVMSPQ